MRLVLCLCLLPILALTGCSSDDQQEGSVRFLIGEEGRIESRGIVVEGESYDVDVVTLTFGVENKSSEPLDVDVSQNVRLIHPYMLPEHDAFRLLKDSEGPYVIRVGSKRETLGIDLTFIQMPGSPRLDDAVMVSVAGGAYILTVELLRESE